MFQARSNRVTFALAGCCREPRRGCAGRRPAGVCHPPPVHPPDLRRDHGEGAEGCSGHHPHQGEAAPRHVRAPGNFCTSFICWGKGAEGRGWLLWVCFFRMPGRKSKPCVPSCALLYSGLPGAASYLERVHSAGLPQEKNFLSITRGSALAWEISCGLHSLES